MDDFGHRVLHRRGDAFRIGAEILLGVAFALVGLISLLALAGRPSLFQALVLGTFVGSGMALLGGAIWGLHTRASWGLAAATAMLLGIAIQGVIQSIISITQQHIDVPLGTIAVVGLLLVAPPALLRRDRPTLLGWLLAYGALSVIAVIASAIING